MKTFQFLHQITVHISPKQRFWGIFVFALAVSLLGLLNHEMWRDELRVWALAHDSNSLLQLMEYINYEGHPVLWYVCIYLISRLTGKVIFMQLFHGIISAFSVYLICRFSPFNRLQKFLLAFSYYFIYEYSLISRGYGLSVCLILVFCSLTKRRDFNLLLLTTVVGLIANTTPHAFLFSISLSIFLAHIWLHKQDYRSIRQKFIHGFLASLILITGWGVASYQSIRNLILQAGTDTGKEVILIASSKSIQVLPQADAVEPIKRFMYTIVQIWKAYVPIPSLGRPNFWNTNIITNSNALDLGENLHLGLALGGLFSVLLFIFSCFILKKSHVSTFVYCFGTALLLLFSYHFAWWGSMRHHGYLFILFLVCLWISQSFSNEQKRIESIKIQGSTNEVGRFSSFKNIFPVLLFLLQFVSGIYFYIADLFLPFSGSQAAAQYIRNQQADNSTLVGYKERQTSSVAIYLNRSVYYPETNRWGKSWQAGAFHEWNHDTLIGNIEKLLTQTSEDVLIIWSEPFTWNIPGSNVEELANFQSSIAGDESFYIYRLKRN